MKAMNEVIDSDMHHKHEYSKTNARKEHLRKKEVD